MAPTDTHIYGEVDNKTNLKEVFLEIREDVDTARSRADLTELHRRAGYLIALTHSSSWEEKFGEEESEALRAVAKEEFGITARKINRRAETIGTEADYDEAWGEGA